MKENKISERKKWATFIGIPFQMVAVIFLGYWCGSFLDRKYAVDNHWWAISLTLLGVLISLYQLIVQVKKLDHTQKKKENNGKD